MITEYNTLMKWDLRKNLNDFVNFPIEHLIRVRQLRGDFAVELFYTYIYVSP